MEVNIRGKVKGLGDTVRGGEITGGFTGWGGLAGREGSGVVGGKGGRGWFIG